MNREDKKDFFRNIPSLEKLLSTEKFKELNQYYPRKLILKISRDYLDMLRRTYNPENELIDCSAEHIYMHVTGELKKHDRKGLKRAINATGVTLHTNLGRTPLCKRAIKRLNEILHGYCTLEIDETGKRGSRHKRVEDLFLELTGAEAAAVVNNDSAAVYLVLEKLAKNREVIISRGELVEIGGGFRIPDVMKRSGCHMVEVGTTNKTHMEDYKKAISSGTGMLLKVHTSNYKIIGFTSSVSVEELVGLSGKEKIPLFYDQGNGLMINLRSYGFEHELNVIESIKAGVDIIAFSGDKLLGGPQAGIILGKKEYIEPLKKDPMMRALRPDKMTLAALEATLEEYLYSDSPDIPLINMLTVTPEKLKIKGEELLKEIDAVKSPDCRISLQKGVTETGGGTFPGFTMPTFTIAIKSPKGAKNIQEKLYRLCPPVYSRIEEDQVLLDLRTLIDEKDRYDLLQSLKKIFNN
ncbi:MAG: L-seryl-tRNA(Sec) selenium transferase [Candidatus Eremiobacterota bacterium]